jgi:ABC-type glycerol-3-phosphate transport system substrate-binding protein
VKAHRFALTTLGVVAIVALTVLVGTSTAFGRQGASPASAQAVSGSITFDGIWTGAEASHFANVIKTFNKSYPKVKVNYKPVGDNLPTVLATAVAGGRPPDMADIAQPGLIRQFVNKGVLKPITYAKSTLALNFNPAWIQLGTFNGKLYGVVFKASNKSLVWYNVHAFKTAGVSGAQAKTWPQFLKLASTVKASGTPPFSIGGADGWTLTDLFENIYLRQAGLAKYQALSGHRIKWTDPTVAKAMKTMAQVLVSANMAGGTSGAVQTDFPTSVNNVFQNPPKASMVMEGDFVPGTATVKAKAGSDYNVFPFPSIGGSKPAVEVAGDTIVTFRDTPAIRAFETFLATPQAAAAYAKYGGFATGNKHVKSSAFPDAISKANEKAVQSATSIVFDMSDQQPGAFGATVGQGEWGLFQDFLRKPSDVAGIQKKLETAAAAAYKKAG